MDIWGIIYCVSAVFCLVSVLFVDILTDTFRRDGRVAAFIVAVLPLINTIVTVVGVYMLTIDVLRTWLGKERMFF